MAREVLACECPPAYLSVAPATKQKPRLLTRRRNRANIHIVYVWCRLKHIPEANPVIHLTPKPLRARVDALLILIHGAERLLDGVQLLTESIESALVDDPGALHMQRELQHDNDTPPVKRLTLHLEHYGGPVTLA